MAIRPDLARRADEWQPLREQLRLGLDIGGTKTHGVVLDRHDHVLAQRALPTRRGPSGLKATAHDLAAGLAATLGVEPSAFTSVGVGIPGLVERETGLVTTAVNIGIEQTNVSRLLADDFTAPVRVENDVKATALGAALVLQERPVPVPGRHGLTVDDITDLCYLNVGTGLAAAAVSNRHLVRGGRNGAGEIGHFAIEPDGVPCRCGQRGCLETVVGGHFLNQRLAAEGLDLTTLDTDPVPAAAAERHRIVDALAHAVLFATTAYDPDVIAIGGGVPQAAAWILPDLIADLRAREAASAFLAGVRISERLVALPQDVPVPSIGAAVVGRKRGLRKPRPAQQPDTDRMSGS